MRNLILFTTLLFYGASSFALFSEVDKAFLYEKNILKNGGFESGKASWTASAGTFAATSSSPMIGNAHATWDAAASADTLTSTAVAIPVGMYGRNGVVSCLITTASGSATHSIQAYDGSSILATAAIVSGTSPARTALNFIFPSSGSLSLRLYANANEPSIAIDDCYLGPAEAYNLNNVSQAKTIGTAYFATTASCTFTRTSTSLGAMSDTDCPGPTVESNPGPGTIQTTDANAPTVTVNSLPPGTYEVGFIGANAIATTAQLAALAISDGTSTLGQVAANNALTSAPFHVKAVFTYTVTANVSFNLFASSAANAFNIDLTASNQRLFFYINRFPSSNEVGYTANLTSQSYSGFHTNTCSWSRTNTALGDPTADATCSLTEISNTNFGTVITADSGGSALPGITWTPNAIGKYYVCAGFGFSNVGAGVQAHGQMLIGATVISSAEARVANSSGSTHTACGIAVVTSLAAQTIKLQTAVASGSVVITNSGAVSPHAITWNIFRIDQSFPNPNILNSVVTAASGGARTAYAKLNCDAGSAITSQEGSWVSSIGNIAAGACAVTLTGSVFTATPYCTAQLATTGGISTGKELNVDATSVTAVSVDCEDDASGECTDFDFILSCGGAK